ncbi:MAG: hypothetical protein Q4P84_04780 [Elusimicrobiales bacterium]|nr:hypothetical protein [Elusimicrobiales bacterium]
MAETSLRQADADVNSVGVVSEKKLEVKTEDGKTSISGYVTIKTSDVNFIRYNVNVNEKTKSGSDNRAYAGIMTVMNEYKSIAEAGEENADKVRVNGNMNPYHSIQDNSDVMAYRANFFNRIKADEEYEPRAEFEVEIYISAIMPEMNTDGEETGRVIVSGWIPRYDNGIEPIKMVAEGEVASAIDSMYEPGQTVRFFGDVINNRITKVIPIPVAIGKPKTKTKTEFKNELIITGASEAYEEGVSENPPYDTATIKAAIQERENRIAEIKAKAASGSTGKTNNARPSAAAHGRTLGF